MGDNEHIMEHINAFTFTILMGCKNFTAKFHPLEKDIKINWRFENKR